MIQLTSTIDWQYLRYQSGRYLQLTRLDGDCLGEKESYTHYVLRIASFAMMVFPALAAITYYSFAQTDPKPTVCLDFVDVLKAWERRDRNLPWSHQPCPIVRALCCDLGRDLMIFSDSSDEINQQLVRFYNERIGRTKPFPNLFPKVRPYGNQFSIEYLNMESVQSDFINKGFNKKDAMLLTLKAFYLTTQFAGTYLHPVAVDVAIKKSVLDCGDILKNHYHKLLWIKKVVSVQNNIPYLIFSYANYLPKDGIWYGGEKTLPQKKYFQAEAKINLLNPVQGPDGHNKTNNKDKFEWEVKEVSQQEINSFYEESDVEIIKRQIAGVIHYQDPIYPIGYRN